MGGEKILMDEKEKELLHKCVKLFPWILDWAMCWFKQTSGYLASDTSVGIFLCESLKKDLKDYAVKNNIN